MTFDVDRLIEAARVRDVVVICTPNNPTGTLLDTKRLDCHFEERQRAWCWSMRLTTNSANKARCRY